MLKKLEKSLINREENVKEQSHHHQPSYLSTEKKEDELIKISNSSYQLYEPNQIVDQLISVETKCESLDQNSTFDEIGSCGPSIIHDTNSKTYIELLQDLTYGIHDTIKSFPNNTIHLNSGLDERGNFIQNGNQWQLEDTPLLKKCHCTFCDGKKKLLNFIPPLIFFCV